MLKATKNGPDIFLKLSMSDRKVMINLFLGERARIGLF